MDLTGKVILVTGASSGIGAAIARELAEAGGRIVLTARNEAKLLEVADRLDGEGHLVLPLDVTKAERVKDVVRRVVDEAGRIDVLVNNAGMAVFDELHELEPEDFDRMIDVNLRGVFLATHYSLPHMYEAGGGTVVTIASLAGKNGFRSGGGYCASKFGVIGMMESLFHESRKRGVRTITLCPGSVDTPFFDEVDMTPAEGILEPEDVAVTLRHALELPERALIREVDIRPANPG